MENIKRVDNAEPTFEQIELFKKRKKRKMIKKRITYILATLFIIFMVQLLMDKKKYYACDNGHICYPEGSIRNGCSREFDRLKDCKIFIKK